MTTIHTAADLAAAIRDLRPDADEPAQTCQCCGGAMPGRTTWEAHRDEAGECDGSIDRQGRCRAWSDAALWEAR